MVLPVHVDQSHRRGPQQHTQTITSNNGGPPFPAPRAPSRTRRSGFCNYPPDGGAPTRITHVTGAKFETSQTDPMVPLTPAYFPLTYYSMNTTTGNAFGEASLPSLDSSTGDPRTSTRGFWPRSPTITAGRGTSIKLESTRGSIPIALIRSSGGYSPSATAHRMPDLPW